MRANRSAIISCSSFVVLCAFVSLWGCTTYHVPLQPALEPLPSVVKVPLVVGVYYSSETRTYRYTAQRLAQHVEVPIGTATTALFDQALVVLFEGTTNIPGPKAGIPSLQSVDAIIEVAIDNCTVETPHHQLISGDVNATITYRFTLSTNQNERIASWQVTGTAHKQASWNVTTLALIGEAADGAMRDAAIKFLNGFSDRPEVKEWLETKPATAARRPAGAAVVASLESSTLPAISPDSAASGGPPDAERQARTHTYAARFDEVWDATLRVLSELGLRIKSADKEHGVIQADRATGATIGETVEVRAKSVDERTTRLEVRSVSLRFSRWFNFPDWEPHVIGNVERKLSDAKHRSQWLLGNYYLSLNLDAGQIGPKINLHPQAAGGFESIKPTQGAIVSLVAGRELAPPWSAELSVGYLGYGNDNCDATTGVCVTNTQKADFSAALVTASLLQHFIREPAFPSYAFHISTGIRYYGSPKLERQDGPTVTTVRYRDTLGYHVGIGGRYGANWFISYEVKYVFGVTYHLRDIVEKGTPSPAAYPDWQSLDGNGVLIGFGLGYHF